MTPSSSLVIFRVIKIKNLLLSILKKFFVLFLYTMMFSQLLILSFILIPLFKCVISHQNLKYEKLELPYGVSGPESTTFNFNGQGPYTDTS